MGEGTQYLTKDEIATASDLKQEEVEVPEWGGKVLVSELSAFQRLKLGEMDAKNVSTELSFMVVVWSCRDGEGKPLFVMLDLPMLKERAQEPIQRIVDKCWELSGLEVVPDDAEEGEEGTGKDSETNPS